MAGIDRRHGTLVGRARVRPGVVGQDPLDPDATLGEPDGRVEEGPASTASALVGHVGDEGEPRGVVDDDLEVVVAPLGPMAMRRVLTAEDPVTATGGDAAELLVVLVDERAWMIVDVADRHAGEAVGIAQSGIAGPGEDGVHGRAGMAEQRSEAVWAPAPCSP